MTAIADPVGFVEQRFGIRMRKAGRTEWAGPCPWCGGTDRFHVWGAGNYWCRPGPGHCAKSGWLDQLDGVDKLTPDELLKLRVDRLERQVAEHDQRLSALEIMHQSEDHLRYHDNLTANDQALDYWYGQGMLRATIDTYLLGYCPNCPTAPGHDSYTIPVMHHGKLYNIRHRLATPNSGGKYRPHMAGLPVMIFNADDLDRHEDRQILIFEGEKKSIVVGQETGLPNIATMGAQSFKKEWAAKLAKFREVVVCYDPDATTKAVEVARYFGDRGRVMRLPAKADDFFVKHLGSAGDFRQHLSQARAV